MIGQIKAWILWAVFIGFLLAFPKLFGIYYTNVFVTFAVFAVFSVSLNLLLGYTGLLSFGHAMYFGAGGYGTALALKYISGLPLLPALGFGVLSAVLLAMIVCPLVVRVSGVAFAMIHLAFAQFLYVLVLRMRGITGGEDGIANFPIPAFTIPGLVSFEMRGAPENFYYFAIIVLGLSVLLMWFFTKTPFGQIQVGIRDNLKRIEYMGFKVPHSKAVIYLVSASFAGVAGSVYALFNNLVSPDGYLGLMVSFTPIINTMLGGIASFFGPMWGAAIYALIEEFFLRFTDKVELVIGAIFILVIMYAPLGFSGFVMKVKLKWLLFKGQRMRKV
ncbi:MAG TPA: branched-chain amino acid ABC transporter permease [Deltaproteobacteria bacterium]|nr:branched-chain amino acid ABC transporter permease [Deltaproteobacteria bacterium]